MKAITSASNGIVKTALRLREKKGRDKEGAFLIEGPLMLEEALRSGVTIRRILFKIGYNDPTRVLPEDIANRIVEGAVTVKLTPEVFDRISDTVTPRGILAIVEKPVRKELVGRTKAGGVSSVVILDRIQDPGNAGTIIRTAEAAGFSGVVAVKGTVDPYSGKVVRSAAGAILRVPIFEADDVEAAMAMATDAGMRIVVCDMAGASDYDRADLRGGIALVIGNEGAGVSEAFREGADLSIKIPMDPGPESLNAAIAAGIIMFEKRRQDASEIG
jgi:TrmH family RNA methyltransferase